MWAHLITTSRLLLAGAFAAVVAILHTGGGGHGLGTGSAALLGALALGEEWTDLADGWVARRTGTASKLGGIYDPLSDSLSRLTIYFSMALAGWVSLAVPLVMTGRDILVAYTRIANALTGGKTSARRSGKAKAVVQGAGIGVVLVLAWQGGAFWAPGARVAAACLIISVTLWSAWDYLRGSLPALRELSSRGR
jgi:CDP-diacylglycerol--glycerol-3-phosphate 3-phosphatidyltransferase